MVAVLSILVALVALAIPVAAAAFAAACFTVPQLLVGLPYRRTGHGDLKRIQSPRHARHIGRNVVLGAITAVVIVGGSFAATILFGN